MLFNMGVCLDGFIDKLALRCLKTPQEGFKTMILENYTLIQNPSTPTTLHALVRIKIPKWHMEIGGIKEFKKEGRRWFCLPAYCKEVDGERKYYPTVKFEGETEKIFLKKVKAVVDTYLDTSNKNT